jgi:hypothetical protein
MAVAAVVIDRELVADGLLGINRLVDVDVMAEVHGCLRRRFVLAIRRSHCPAHLEQQRKRKEEREEATHGKSIDEMPVAMSRKCCARAPKRVAVPFSHAWLVDQDEIIADAAGEAALTAHLALRSNDRRLRIHPSPAPLAKGPSLCHGTAGGVMACLKL